MAHYARLGVNNVVIRVDIVDNSKVTTSGGIEKDALAFDHLYNEFGAGIWAVSYTHLTLPTKRIV